MEALIQTHPFLRQEAHSSYPFTPAPRQAGAAEGRDEGRFFEREEE